MKFSDINPFYTVKGRALMAAKKRTTKRKPAKRKTTAKRRLPPRHKSGPKKGQFKTRRG